MPGGRVKPVIFVKPVDLQKQKLLDDAKKAQMEEVRKKALVAQQAAREEEERVAADQKIRDLRMKDEEKLRVAHETKLAEGSAPTDLKTQQDADEELKRWQMNGLAAEKQRELDAVALKKLETPVSTTIDAVDVPLMPTSAPIVTPIPVLSTSMVDDSTNTDAELAAIRDRINSILNSDLVVPNVVV